MARRHHGGICSELSCHWTGLWVQDPSEDAPPPNLPHRESKIAVVRDKDHSINRSINRIDQGVRSKIHVRPLLLAMRDPRHEANVILWVAIRVLNHDWPSRRNDLRRGVTRTDGEGTGNWLVDEMTEFDPIDAMLLSEGVKVVLLVAEFRRRRFRINSRGAVDDAMGNR